MSFSATTNLGLPLITTGTESGNWGDIVDNGLTSYIDIAVTGTLSLTSASFTANALTLSNTFGTSSATNIAASTAQYAVIKLSSLAAAVTITAPSVSKTYVIANTDSTYAATIKASGQTGVSIAAGEMAVVWFNGTDYVKVMSQLVYASSRVPYGNGTMNFNTSAQFQYNGTYLLVGAASALGGLTNPVAAFTGNPSTTNYVQAYVYNSQNGISSSGDFVAYASNSTDAHGWADMGFTSPSYADPTYTVTGPNEAYVLGSAPYAATPTVTGNLVYATDSTGTQNYHQWYVGGFTQAKSAWKMQLTPTGLQLANALGGAYGGTGLTSPGAAGNALISDGTNWTSAANSTSKIQPISASVAANALTISASALTLDFRSTALGSGTVTTVSGTPSNLVVPSGATLGSVNASLILPTGPTSRLIVLALNNAGTIELGVVNLAGGVNLTETGVISTTAISSSATSASVVYSATARTSVAYRVIGYIESTQTTAGTWATAPSTIQGAGGQALTAMSSLGYGQTWQSVTGSRTSGTTYYNTTGKPIFVEAGVQAVSGTPNITVVVNGVTIVNFTFPYGTGNPLSFIVPPSASYSYTIAAGTTLNSWTELS